MRNYLCKGVQKIKRQKYFFVDMILQKYIN